MERGVPARAVGRDAAKDGGTNGLGDGPKCAGYAAFRRPEPVADGTREGDPSRLGSPEPGRSGWGDADR